MTKIDWYILRKYLGTFFFSLLIFIVISVVIDITEKLDDFITNDISLREIIFDYYIGFIPHIAALLFPLFIFISVIFFTSKMAYRSEIIAILSSGVSFRRFLRPYLVGACLLGLLLWGANQWTVPAANRIRTRFENKYINDKNLPSYLQNIHVRIDSVTYITMDYYNPQYKTGDGFKLEKIKDQTLYYLLKADRINWDSTAGVWRIDLASVHEINGMRENLREQRNLNLRIPLSPKDLMREHNIWEALTTPELNRYIEREKLRGAEGLNYLYVEKYRRTSAAVAVIILTFIGAIIASRKVRGGSGLHLAIGIVISASYILFMQFSTTFSVKGNLNPFIATWIPNLIFSGLAFWLYRQAPK